MRLLAGLLLGTATFATTPRALAESPEEARNAVAARAPYPLRNTTPLFLGIELAGAASIVAVSVLSFDPATHCGWCQTNAFDRSVRRALVMSDSRAAATVSHVLSSGVAPGIALAGTLIPAFSHGHAEYVLEDSVLMVDAALLTFGVTDGTKKLADRRRPAFVYGREKSTEYGDHPEQEFVSFYSSDTALAFTFASSGATVAFLRGYPTAPYVAIAGGAVALGAGVLRISADMHWATDVITGALVGTGIGVGMPYLLHGRDASTPRLAVAPSITNDHAMLVAAGEF